MHFGGYPFCATNDIALQVNFTCFCSEETVSHTKTMRKKINMFTYSACGSKMMRVSVLSSETSSAQLSSSLAPLPETMKLVLDIT